MRRRGVTLVEVIVAISIIAVLLALAAPSLLSTRHAARERQCLAVMRSIGQAAYAWAADNKNFFPYVGVQGRLWDVYTIESSGTSLGWFDNRWAWTLALKGYLPRRDMLCPGHPALDPDAMRQHPDFEESTGTAFILSHALFTNWAMWKESDPATTMDQLRPVRIDEVSHPSNKSMYIEQIPFHISGYDHSAYLAAMASSPQSLSHGVNTILVDGSGRSPALNTLSPGPHPPAVFLPGHPDEDELASSPGGFPLITTLDGFMGRDFN